MRCFWAGSDPVHDREWGFPVADDQRLFEKIRLEGCAIRGRSERAQARFRRPQRR